MGERRLQQHKRAVNISLEELRGPVDRAVDMRLGSQVKNGIWVKIPQQAEERLPITNVGLIKPVPGVAFDSAQRHQIRGVGHFVDVQNRRIQLANQHSANCRADKSRPTCDQQLHNGRFRSAARRCNP